MLNRSSAIIKRAKKLSEQKQDNLQNPRTSPKIWKGITLLDMYICIYICICMWDIYIYVCVCVCVCLFVCVCVCVHIYLYYIHKYAYTFTWFPYIYKYHNLCHNKSSLMIFMIMYLTFLTDLILFFDFWWITF